MMSVLHVEQLLTGFLPHHVDAIKDFTQILTFKNAKPAKQCAKNAQPIKYAVCVLGIVSGLYK